MLLTENASKGVQFTRVRLVIDTASGEVVYKTADFHRPWTTGVTPDPDIQARLDELNAETAADSGTADRDIDGGDPAGRLLRHRKRPHLREPDRQCGHRRDADDLRGRLRDHQLRRAPRRSHLPGRRQPGRLLPRGAAGKRDHPRQGAGVLPFGNVVSTVEITGAELKTMLENGVAAMPEVAGAFPQVSGLCFTYDITLPAGQPGHERRPPGRRRQLHDRGDST